MVSRFGVEEVEAVKRVVESGELSSFYRSPEGGRFVKEFEERLAEFFKTSYAVVFNSGTSALFASLLALGVGKGMRVAVPSLTFVATATAPLMCGAEVVFVDVDDTLNMNAEDLKEKAEKYGVDAIIPVHLLGNPCDMGEIKKIASELNVPIVEDACQAIGAKYGGRYVGTLGDVGVFSFQETKTITTLGEGGVALTDEEWIARRLKIIRNHGEKYFRSSILGYNFRMTEAQAAFGLVQLEKLQAFNDMQVKNAKSFLRKLPRVFTPQRRTQNSLHVYSIVGTFVRDEPYRSRREELVRLFAERGVSKTKPGSTVSLGYTSPVYSDVSLFHNSLGTPCRAAEKLTGEMVWFDIHRWKTEEEFEPVMCEALKIIEEWIRVG